VFIATANQAETIPGPLLDRMEVIRFDGYTVAEKVAIARGYLWPRQVERNGLKPDEVEIADEAIERVVTEYTREAGVRNLERQVAAICRKVASEVATGRRAQRMRLTESKMETYLGPGRFGADLRDTENQVGVTMGLGTTDTGGELIPVEVAVMPGAGALLVTGQAGEVMRESARAGFTYIRSCAEKLGISADFPSRCDVHIHLPEAAIPKDGPSAGITMVTALVSALTGTPVRADVAMTGEVTLRGRVLPIGGLRDKTLAAHRAGIRRVIAPMANRSDLARIPKRVAAEMEFIWVEHMDEVLAAALDHDTSPMELSTIEHSVVEHFSGYVFTVKQASAAKNRLAG
jgi:ATP-dependent Lon protease